MNAAAVDFWTPVGSDMLKNPMAGQVFSQAMALQFELGCGSSPVLTLCCSTHDRCAGMGQDTSNINHVPYAPMVHHMWQWLPKLGYRTCRAIHPQDRENK